MQQLETGNAAVRVRGDTATSAATASTVDRRALYRRSNTLSALPVGGLNERCRLEPIKDSPNHETENAVGIELQHQQQQQQQQQQQKSSQYRLSEDDRRRSDDVTRGLLSGGNDATASCAAARTEGPTAALAARRSTFMRKASCNDLLLTGNRSAAGAISSGSSSIFSKVRDRIRETVLTTEWSAAVILEERHQRAAEQYEAAARSRLQQPTASVVTAANGSGTPSNMATRRHSPANIVGVTDTASYQQQKPLSNRDITTVGNSPTAGTSRSSQSTVSSAVGRREASRAAFRRRSISCEDAYASMNTHLTIGSSLPPQRSTSAKGSAETIGQSDRFHDNSIGGNNMHQRGGVVCSNDDFRSIVYDLGRQLKVGQLVTSSPSVESQRTNDSSRSSPEPCSSKRGSRDFCSKPDTKQEMILPLVIESSAAASSVGSETAKQIKSLDASNADVTNPEEKDEDLQGEPTRRQSIPPPEVEFDEKGQTWGVYGAELDPEILGSAIQSHLERIMTSSKVCTAEDGNGKAVGKSPTKCGQNLYDCIEIEADTDANQKLNNNRKLVTGSDSRGDNPVTSSSAATAASRNKLLARISCLIARRRRKINNDKSREHPPLDDLSKLE